MLFKHAHVALGACCCLGLSTLCTLRCLRLPPPLRCRLLDAPAKGSRQQRLLLLLLLLHQRGVPLCEAQPATAAAAAAASCAACKPKPTTAAAAAEAEATAASTAAREAKPAAAAATAAAFRESQAAVVRRGSRPKAQPSRRARAGDAQAAPPLVGRPLRPRRRPLLRRLLAVLALLRPVLHHAAPNKGDRL